MVRIPIPPRTVELSRLNRTIPIRTVPTPETSRPIANVANTLIRIAAAVRDGRLDVDKAKAMTDALKVAGDLLLKDRALNIEEGRLGIRPQDLPQLPPGKSDEWHPTPESIEAQLRQ